MKNFIRYSPLSEDKSKNLRNTVEGQRPIWSNKSQRTQKILKILSEDKWAIYFIYHNSIELFFLVTGHYLESQDKI